MKLTKQGVRDLSSKQINVRRKPSSDECFHNYEIKCDLCERAWYLMDGDSDYHTCPQVCKKCGDVR